MKTIFRFLFIIFLFLIISNLFPVKIDDFFINTIFTVAGIMFSVGLGLIVTFSFAEIKNKKYLHKIRDNLNAVRDSFLQYFTIVTFCYVIDYYLRKSELYLTTLHISKYEFNFNWSVFLCLLIIYSIIYFIINFIKIQKLNNDIVDKVINEDKGKV